MTRTTHADRYAAGIVADDWTPAEGETPEQDRETAARYYDERAHRAEENAAYRWARATDRALAAADAIHDTSRAVAVKALHDARQYVDAAHEHRKHAKACARIAGAMRAESGPAPARAVAERIRRSATI